MSFLRQIYYALRRLFFFLLPMFLRVREQAGSRSLFWVLHVLTLIVVLVLLEVLHQALNLQSMLESVWPLNQVWLPLLFLLFYLLCWLIWWFWHLLGAPEVTPFPDIDRAWGEALTALAEKQIDLTDSPLFLVLGRPEDGEEVLFSGTRLQVPGAPRRDDAPLHVYAGRDAQGRDAIYVTCVGASLLGLQSLVLAGEADLLEETSSHDPVTGGGGPVTMIPRGTLVPESDDEAKQVLDRYRVIKAIEDAAKSERRPLTRAERLQIIQLNRRIRRGDRPQMLHNQVAVIEERTERLRHLCGLIARARRPFCGLNGILLVFPLAGTEDDEDAVETGACCRDDLRTVRAAFQVDSPVITLVSGLDQVEGFEALVENMSRDDLQRRLGQRFPLVPDVDPPAKEQMVSEGVGWIATTMFPNLALPVWRLETPENLDTAAPVRQNAELYRFLSQIRGRLDRLARGVNRCVDGTMLGGCYIAGTGRDGDRDRAFLPGVLIRLTDEQDNVTWTEDAFDDEHRFRRLTRGGYIVLLIVIALGLAAIAYRVLQR
jgi:hypothetical protein